MKLDKYVQTLQELLELIKAGKLDDIELRDRLTVGDNHVILLNGDCTDIVEKIRRDLANFEFKKHFAAFSGDQVDEFFYRPGTLELHVSPYERGEDWCGADYATHLGKRHVRKISLGYNVELKFHPDQGTTIGGLRTEDIGKVWEGVSEEVATAVGALEIIDFIRKYEIPACIPGHFFINPEEELIPAIVYYPDSVDEEMNHR